MAWLWAPKNTIQSIFFLPPLVRSVDLSIGTFALIFIGLDLGFAILRGSGGQFSSEFLHVLGAAVGLPLGIAMLRKGWVDCEGWDWFSVRRGDHIRGGAVVYRPAKAAATPEPAVDEDRELALDGIRESLAERNPAQALVLHRDAAGDGRWLLPEPELRGLALLLAKEGAWEDAAPLLEEHVGRFPTGNALVRIRLAEHYLERASRPSRARELLLGVDPARLPPAAAVHREKLLRLCQERIDSGAFELLD